MKKRATLLLDCGNSYVKWCLNHADSLSEQQAEYHKNASMLSVFQLIIDTKKHQCEAVVMVSVLGEAFSESARRISIEAGLAFYEASSQRLLGGITSAYQDPTKIGADRLVAISGAYAFSAKSACIVVDTGTATTIDAVDRMGTHLGGVIFSGLQASLEGLFRQTEQLPLVGFNEEKLHRHGFATNTEQAIFSGCLLSLAGGIDSICDNMQTQISLQCEGETQAIKRILCGGNAKVLLGHLKGTYDIQENLVLQGLYTIKDELT